MNESELRACLDIKIPVTIEVREGEPDLIATPDGVELQLDFESYNNHLAEYLAMAKMAEKDYLLVSFYTQKDCSEEENVFFGAFYQLCQPLLFAWEYGILRRYVPEVYQEQITGIREDWELIKNNPKVPVWDKLRNYAILAENPENRIPFSLDSENPQWQNFTAKMLAHLNDEPDVAHLLDLADATNPLYSIKVVEEDGLRFFSLKK